MLASLEGQQPLGPSGSAPEWHDLYRRIETVPALVLGRLGVPRESLPTEGFDDPQVPIEAYGTCAQSPSVEEPQGPSDATIKDRGRGPEIVGTRITIYRIMDFIKYNYKMPDIARELELTDSQVIAAVEYIRAHQEESDREYGLIMERMNQQNPPEVERDRATTKEELRQRLRARLERKGAHDHTVGQ